MKNPVIASSGTTARESTYDIPTCQELVERIMTEAEAIIDRRLAAMRAAATGVLS